MRVFIFLLLLTFVSCTRQEFTGCDDNMKDAIIRWTGSVLTDGCDWLIEVGSKRYATGNLPDAFKQDGKQVSVCFTVTRNKVTCGLTSEIQVIDIIEIR